MKTTFQTKTRTALALFVVGAPLMMATSGGAPAGTSGAPGESTCVACHGGQPNGGSGKLQITFGGGTPTSVFTPGQKTRLRVTIEDANARRWGFQLTARLEDGATAGSLQSVDGTTQVVNQGGSQWITHTPSGTRTNTRGPVSFEFDWTSPVASSASTPVVFYAAANAANGNGSTSGDQIYAATLRVTAASPAPLRPSFGASAVTDLATRQPGMAPGAWVSVEGSDLASLEAFWSPVSGQPLPTTLAGVKVRVNDVPAAVASVKPDRLTFLVPAETPEGEIPVVIESDGRISDPVLVRNSRALPAVLGVPDPDAKEQRIYATVTTAGMNPALSLVATRGWILGKSAADPRAVRGVYPGEEIDIYAVGLGRTKEEFRTDRLVTGHPPLADPVTVMLGETVLDPVSTALVAPGVYVLRVKTPESLPPGDVPVTLQTNSIQSRPNVFLFVERQP
jgi:uncharacterized protein (TIGR03437 family)